MLSLGSALNVEFRAPAVGFLGPELSTFNVQLSTFNQRSTVGVNSLPSTDSSSSRFLHRSEERCRATINTRNDMKLVSLLLISLLTASLQISAFANDIIYATGFEPPGFVEGQNVNG